MNIQMVGDADELRLKPHDESDRRFIRAVICVALDGGRILAAPKDDPEAIELNWPNGGERVPRPKPPEPTPTWTDRLTSPAWLKTFFRVLILGR